MNICFIYKEDYPWDVRVEKIIKTLVADGNNVVLGCQNLKGLPSRDNIEGVRIVRMPYFKPPLTLLTKLLNAPFFLNPVWFWLVWKAASVNSADTIIVRDLPLMPIAIIVAKLSRRRVVFDMAECYPEMYASIVHSSFRSKLLKSVWLAGVIEKFSVHHSDLIMVMIEESRDRLLAMGFSPKKIKIVSNTPPLPELLSDPDHHNTPMLKLLYVGFVTEIRGIDLTVRGISVFRSRRPEVKLEFDIVGVGSAARELTSLIEKLELNELISCHGWCEQDFVDQLYEQCNVGVLTYQDCPHWRHTIPNKLFDYMLAGYPVLTTAVKPIARIVEGTGCGVVCHDGTPESVADALELLIDSKNRQKMGAAGQKAVLERYNWNNDAEVMLVAIDKLASGCKSSRC